MLLNPDLLHTETILEPPGKLNDLCEGFARVGLGATGRRNLVIKMRGAASLVTPCPKGHSPATSSLPVPLILLIVQTTLQGT